MPAEVKAMTVGDLRLLDDHWLQFPPVHVTAAALVGRRRAPARIRGDVPAQRARAMRLEIERQMRKGLN